MADTARPQADEQTATGQWFGHEKCDLPTYEQIISETQAVHEAMAALGRDAPTEKLRQCLAGRGIKLDAAVIDRIRAETFARPDHGDGAVGG